MDGFYIKKSNNAKDLELPKFQTELSAGMDLHANITEKEIIQKGERKLIPTGIEIAIPKGYEGQIRARSGLALKYGIGLVNSIGTIDADYRGELKVLLINLGEEDFHINRGDRIAQLVINKVELPIFTEVDELDQTSRGVNGYGHTGK